MPITSIYSQMSEGLAGQSFRQIEQGVARRLQVDNSESAQLLSVSPGKSNFVDMMKDFVGDVSAHQLRAGKTIDAFAAGEVTDVHEVMVAVQEAGLALDLLLEIRNRTQEVFQEIMRLQV